MSVGPDELVRGWCICIAATGAVAAITGTFLYRRAEKRGRSRWWEVPDGEMAAAAQAGPFRSAGTVTRYLPRAPALIRRASFGSMVLGLCAVPLVVLLIVLLPLAGFGLIFVPGILTGMKLFSAGRALLARAFCAPAEVASATRWTVVLSSIHLGLVALLVAEEPTALAFGLVSASPAIAGLIVARALGRAISLHRAALDFEA